MDPHEVYMCGALFSQYLSHCPSEENMVSLCSYTHLRELYSCSYTHLREFCTPVVTSVCAFAQFLFNNTNVFKKYSCFSTSALISLEEPTEI